MPITSLGKYTLIAQIGRGGFGTVYRAHDTVLDVDRAVKVLHPQLGAEPEFIERFRREAVIMARLEHPNIVPVYEFGEAKGYYYLVMKYLPAGSLKDVLAKSGRLPFTRALDILRQIGAALDYAYSRPQKLIHRDIKPGNILFDQDPHGGRDDIARLADFGFARALRESGSISTSVSGGLIGTPAYMAPEIWRERQYTKATDVYSLACLFFEMITGKVLFEGDSPAVVMTHHVLDGPQLPANWPQGVPAGIERVLWKALSQDPGERYSSVGDFVEALENPLADETANLHVNSTDSPIPRPLYGKETEHKRRENISNTRPGLIKWLAGGLGAVLALAFILWGLMNLMGRVSGGVQQPLPALAAATREEPANMTVPSLTNVPAAVIPSATLAPVQPTVVKPAVLPTKPTTPTDTPDMFPRTSNFMACQTACEGDRDRNMPSFPPDIKKLYLEWDYENFPKGAHYIREWNVNGSLWARYDCTWNGSMNGTETRVTLTDPAGLDSGFWTLTIIVDDKVALMQSFEVAGNRHNGDPPLYFTSCYGKSN